MLKAIQIARKYYPNDVEFISDEIHYDLIHFQFIEAKELLKRAEELEPNNTGLYDTRGRIAMLLNDEMEVRRINNYLAEHTNNTCDKIKKDIIVPCIIESKEAMIETRRYLAEGIKNAEKLNVTLDYAIENCDMVSLFYLPYMGFNDKDIMVNFSQMVRNKTTQLVYTADWLKDGYKLPELNKKIKIGFISRIFNTFSPHVELLEGVIKSLPYLGYEVYMFSFNDMPNERDMPGVIKKSLALETYFNKRMIEELELDILVYADILSGWQVYVLANMRLAGIQVYIYIYFITYLYYDIVSILG